MRDGRPFFFFFFQAEDGIRDLTVTGVQTCALPICPRPLPPPVTGALAGVRVLDLADQQGAFAGKLLAGLGADVVLVEPPEGSPLRSIPPFWQGVEDPERSLFFWFYNAGKRGIALDWRRPEGAERLRRLAARADVVIETEPPGTLAALGLRALNPRLVIASITPFGQTGPYRAWRASDTVAQAMGGMMFVNGHRDGPPLRALDRKSTRLNSSHSQISYAVFCL